jgi:hypothetical protein
MYGPRFLRDYGDRAPPPWQSAIRSIPDRELKRGFRRLTAAGSGSVPTLPQFVKACKAIGDDDGEPGPAIPYKSPTGGNDEFDSCGNYALLRHLLAVKQQPDEEALQRLVDTKNRMVKDFRGMNREADVSGEEMRLAFIAAFGRITG